VSPAPTVKDCADAIIASGGALAERAPAGAGAASAEQPTTD